MVEPISADKKEDETISNFISFSMDEPKVVPEQPEEPKVGTEPTSKR